MAAVERLKSDFIREFPLVRRELDRSVPPGKDPVSRRIDPPVDASSPFPAVDLWQALEGGSGWGDLLRARNNLSDSEMRINQGFP